VNKVQGPVNGDIYISLINSHPVVNGQMVIEIHVVWGKETHDAYVDFWPNDKIIDKITSITWPNQGSITYKTINKTLSSFCHKNHLCPCSVTICTQFGKHQIFSYWLWSLCQCPRGDFGAWLIKILVFPSPNSYVLSQGVDCSNNVNIHMRAQKGYYLEQACTKCTYKRYIAISKK
jgi:hypothetical protein